MRKVLLATPCHSGRVTAQFCLSLINSIALLAANQIDARLSIRAGNSIIGFARNEILAQFLASDCEDLVMIDDDMGWAADDLLRLLTHDVPLVAAVGRIKTDEVRFCVTPLDAAGKVDPVGELVSVGAVGTAFMRIRRDCAMTMIALSGQDAHYAARGIAPDLAPWLFNVFCAGVVDGEPLSEDYAFCRRWRDSGRAVLVDPSIFLEHVGSKAYAGRLADIMKEPDPNV